MPKLQFKLYGSLTEQVNKIKFLGLKFDSNLNWKAHLTGVPNKVCRIIGLLHKFKYFIPSYILIMIYNSLPLPHINYSLLAWGSKNKMGKKIQKKAIRVVKFKSPIAHSETILKTMNQLKLSDMYTCYLLKLYYKLYRNRLPPYVEKCIPVYDESGHNLRNRCIHLPHHTTPHHTTPHHTTPHHTTPHHTTPRHATPRHATPHHTTPRHATPYHTIPYHL